MNTHFTFIDLFAGIGGFHLAMHELGGECVFSSEIDEAARKTYQYNFSKLSPNLFENGFFNKDIKSIMPEEIPDFDLLCAGFPCQPFSQAGKKHGFDDTLKSERGNLFFDIAEIIKIKRPKAYFLENVRGLLNHDNGNTFKTIQDILTNELGYSFYYQVVKASDYGLPQLRPRTFIVGFRDDYETLKGFNFPSKVPLRFNMSDVWGGNCSREIGFTLRVGGRGSKITDRRNWDSYLVDGEVKKISFVEAKIMQGFPDDFHFPVSNTQAMKQLGNSVAVDAVKYVGESLINYMNILDTKDENMTTTSNKGEWTELFAFIKLLLEQKLYLSDEKLNTHNSFFEVKKITTKNLNLAYVPINQFEIEVINKTTNKVEIINIKNIITTEILSSLCDNIKEGKGAAFSIPNFEIVQSHLGFSVVKGGTSSQKADIVLDIKKDGTIMTNEGFGIKSYLGSKPTLLNASGNTNFIFEIQNLEDSKIEAINQINTRTKLKDRIQAIIDSGGTIKYHKAEKDTMNYNLKMADSLMPNIIGYILIAFYKNRITKLKDITNHLINNTDILNELNINDKAMLENKLKVFLVDILLGFFAGTKWDGSYISNGTIVVKSSGDIVAFHIIEMETLKNYLYENIRLDTPSTSRHRFGTIIQGDGNKKYLKLNLQLRF